MEKLERAKHLLAVINTILDLHRTEFPPATPPVAPPSPQLDEAEVMQRHLSDRMVGVGRFDRSGRAAARAAAEAGARAELDARRRDQELERSHYQQGLDALWALLVGNDPDVVLWALAEAFEDNDAAAAPVGVVGDEASLVVWVPSPVDLPDRMPGVTDAGNVSLRKMTRRESADLYRLMVCGYVLVTIKEAFAVAPGLGAVRIVAVRRTTPDAYGRCETEAVLAARFTRASLQGVRWDDADSTAVVRDTADELTVRTQGASEELTALDLADQPDLAAAIAAVDLSPTD
jgi:hypothetical protein